MRSIALLICLMVSGCGFHLRGMMDIPPWLTNVAIIIQSANRDLEPLLKQQLHAYHINVADNPLSASYWLIIERDNTQQQISSISSSTTPRQYQLIYTVNFKLQQAKGREIIPSSQIVVTRQITINSDRILGSTNEEELSKSDMRRDAAMQMISRMSLAHEH